MKKVRKLLEKLPTGIFSLLTLIFILWLTLAPKPFGDETPPMFPGADKLAHGIMFGFFTVMLCLDWQRKHQWQKVTIAGAFTYATVSALLGVIIEILQSGMGLGRSFEYEDIIADSVGAYLMSALWLGFQRNRN